MQLWAEVIAAVNSDAQAHCFNGRFDTPLESAKGRGIGVFLRYMKLSLRLAYAYEV